MFLVKTFSLTNLGQIESFYYNMGYKIGCLLFLIIYADDFTEEKSRNHGWGPSAPALVFGKYKYRQRNIQEDIIR